MLSPKTIGWKFLEMNPQNENPLSVPLLELFEKLNIYNGLLRRLEDALTQFKRTYREFYEGQGDDRLKAISSHTLAILDLSESPDEDRITFNPTGRFTVYGSQYVLVADRLLHRDCSWTISIGYEAFETYLNDLLAYAIHIDRSLAKSDKLSKYDKKSRKSFNKEGIEYWKDFVRYAYKRDNLELLKRYQELEPDISLIEKKNLRKLDLTEWFNVVTRVRHAVTHSNMIIKPDRLRLLSTSEKRILRKNFPGKNYNGGYQLEVGVRNAICAIQIFAEYAFIIFKYLSLHFGYEWQILPSH
jgi:hypothetical protein